MKKVVSILTTGLMLVTLCTPAFATAPQSAEETVSKTYTLAELQNDPNVSFMADDSIIQTRSSSYTSYIDVPTYASVYGKERSYDTGTFGSEVSNIEFKSGENNGDLTVKLCKVDYLGQYTSKQSQKKSIDKDTTSKTYSLGRHDGGQWAFQYTTSGSLALKADVTMYSK